MGWDRTGYADSPGDLLSTGHEKAGTPMYGIPASLFTIVLSAYLVLISLIVST